MPSIITIVRISVATVAQAITSSMSSPKPATMRRRVELSQPPDVVDADCTGVTCGWAGATGLGAVASAPLFMTEELPAASSANTR